MFRLCLMTSVVFSRPERMKTFNWRWYFELTSALEWSRLLKLLYLSKKILYERQLKERKVDKIVKVLKNLRNVVFKQLQKEYLKIVANHILQPVNCIRTVEMNMSVRNLFHENYVAMSKEFKDWTDIHWVSLKLDLDLDQGD